MTRHWILTLLVFPVNVLLAEPLAGTSPLTWDDEDLSVRLMDSAHAFVEGEIEKAGKYLPAGTLEERRAGFRKRIGVVEKRLTPRLEFFSEDPASFDGSPSLSLVCETTEFTVHQIRWDVIPGLIAEGLYVNPVTEEFSTVTPPAIVVVPDAGTTPEDILGLTKTLPPSQQIGLRFATAGFRVIIPAVINREIYKGPDGKDSRLGKSNQTHREWIYRQAFQMGRHVIGYEVQTALAAGEWLRGISPGGTVSIAGYGEGGLTAFYSGACEEVFDAAIVSGYIAPRRDVWTEPIYRNVFNLLHEGGDAGIATLFGSRTLLIEHSKFPEIVDQKGAITTPEYSAIEKEVERIGTLLGTFSSPPNFLLAEANGEAQIDYPASAAFCAAIDHQIEVPRVAPIRLMMEKRQSFDPEKRHRRIFHQTEQVVQKLIRDADETRDRFFLHQAEPKLVPGKWSTDKSLPTLDPGPFIEKARDYREIFRRELIGEFDVPLADPNPRTRKIIEKEKWTAWEVVLDVHGDFFAWGVLLLPNDLKPGEKRPVVVCQHGRNGVPRDTIDHDKTAYSNYAAVLAERGFITFAPHNLYRHEDRYRWLDRKANSIGCTLFSFITPSHQQILNWLKTQPNVDGKRIAFYGLSYGGETAVRVPALVEDYALSICSGDFNQWTRKVAATDFSKGFMKSIEWEMPYWNLGNTFDYSEMAALIFPRPFMVERGHHDGVSLDAWVAHEYAKVRWLYAQFGMSDRTEIEFFQGGHSINGEGTFRFLHKHLEWPEPEE